MALLVELVLLLLDGLAVAIEARLEIEEVGHELDHRDRVAVAPERDRHQEDLGDGGEEQDGDPPVARQPMAPFHDGIEDVGDRLDHWVPLSDDGFFWLNSNPSPHRFPPSCMENGSAYIPLFRKYWTRAHLFASNRDSSRYPSYAALVSSAVIRSSNTFLNSSPILQRFHS